MSTSTKIQTTDLTDHQPRVTQSALRQDSAATQTEIQNLSDTDLESKLKTQVTQETTLTIQILHLLAEVERRQLYSQNYPSLFEYCTRGLKYSPGSAQRRIDTMRASRSPRFPQSRTSGVKSHRH